MKAQLVFEDGTMFAGETPRPIQDKIGEVILNTAVVGYQEMLTDPANAGKILVLTYPLIGNYGIAPKFDESRAIWLAGLVCKDISRMYSNWQATGGFGDFVKARNLSVLNAVDTRTVAVHLRDKGEMWGIVSSSPDSPQALLAKLKKDRKEAPPVSFQGISTERATKAGKTKGNYTLAVLDLGLTQGLIAQLTTLGCSLHIFPFDTDIKTMLKIKPHGLVISNGPEGAAEFPGVAANIRACIKKVPILGISTGCQALAVALGAKTKKMKIGHRGVNYPISYPPSLKGEITVQNHSWAIDGPSLKKIKDVKASAFNLNDQSIEEIESKKLRIRGVQYYPTSPGFGEASPVLKRFLATLKA